MGVILISHPTFPALKKHEKFCLCITKNLQSKYFLLGYLQNTESELLCRRSQANCLAIFHLLAETKTMYRSP